MWRREMTACPQIERRKADRLAEIAERRDAHITQIEQEIVECRKRQDTALCVR